MAQKVPAAGQTLVQGAPPLRQNKSSENDFTFLFTRLTRLVRPLS